MIIGCVKEIKKYEFRVGLTPSAASEYVRHGHTVWIERSAGLGSGFTDEAYEALGCKIVADPKAIWAGSDMIVKVKEPLESEYALFKENLILYTYLHLASNEPLYRALKEKRVLSIAYETMEYQKMLPCLEPMSMVAGRLSILEAAKYSEAFFGGSGILISGLPGTPRAKVTIIGAGVVGQNACRMAVGMEAQVTVLDLDTKRLAFLEDLYHNKINTLYSNQENLKKAILEADIVIGAVLIPGDAAPKLIKDEYLPLMKPGSIVVDVAIDQGGISNFSKVTYHDNPIFKVGHVLFYGVANMPGSVPMTSSTALNNATLSYGLEIADKGIEQALLNPVIQSGLQTRNGLGVYPTLIKLFETK
ncbi:alanine dehydrogenase [Acholeplasma vituli]|uniref:Alanine dehydrogenase n=1 Tax=Paracholeplasma vituli TaxID=69473 RepID=A0ABT2PXG3_9MOLU|nr:alanine dehydrogenase [Paracholeplasma vituli]MCU0104402.1 alanine dehydrogenase [Paracholeplasma vituli]